jgi:hypothetical protein
MTAMCRRARPSCLGPTRHILAKLVALFVAGSYGLTDNHSLVSGSRVALG